MGDRTARRCHYLNEENVPLSVAVCEALAASDRSWPATGSEGSPLQDYLDIEVVDALFTESLVKEEGVSLSLQLTLPGARVDIHTDHAYSDEPVRIQVTPADR